MRAARRQPAMLSAEALTMTALRLAASTRLPIPSFDVVAFSARIVVVVNAAFLGMERFDLGHILVT
ncbi:hypothetical protein BH688_03065 [Kushneria phosphatilytica]|nr:hypothetical protein BH688_03065 [Kushneria phosphatilytica]